MTNSAPPAASAPLAVQPLAASMRVWLTFQTLPVLISGFQLYILSGQTERFFAWTIAPPLTAAFMGAAYFSSVPLLLLSARQATWAHARLAVFGVLAFTTLTLFVTMLHLDRFHLASGGTPARVAAWTWLIVYVAAPPLLALLLIWQSTRPGGEPARQAPLAVWARLALLALGTLPVMLGALLFVFPTAPVWPWALTPLTGRTVAAWLVGTGVIALQMLLENDWRRVRSGAASFIVFALLQLLALARYAGTVRWLSLAAIVYVLYLLAMALAGIYGWYQGGLTSRQANPAPALTLQAR